MIPPSHADYDPSRLARMSAELRLIRFLPFLVLAVSLIVAYQLWQDARQNAMQALQADFDSRAHEAETHVEQRMAVYEQALRGAKGLFAASVSVGRDEFHAYANALRLEENYPGVQGGGVCADRAAAAERAAYRHDPQAGLPRLHHPPGRRA